jgi:hypothetical protein
MDKKEEIRELKTAIRYMDSLIDKYHSSEWAAFVALDKKLRKRLKELEKEE